MGSPPSGAWTKALREHDTAVTALLQRLRRIPESQWDVASAPGKWTTAEEVLHVALAYEIALLGVRTGAGMRPRVSPSRARLLRWVVLPVILNTAWFPRARAPVEIRPETADPAGKDLAAPALLARLQHRAHDVRQELPRAGSGARFHHAYFGYLAPRQAMRMLAAHTRHHTRALDRRFRNVME